MKTKPVPTPISLPKFRIDASLEIYAKAEEWRAKDQILYALRVADSEMLIAYTTTYKMRTLGNFYSAGFRWLKKEQVSQYANYVMNINKVMPQIGDNLNLIDSLAQFPNGKKYPVFASKFAHFFIDPDAFPILDDYSEKMVQYYSGIRKLGEGRKEEVKGKERYEKFFRQFQQLKDNNNLNEISNKTLDQYLWLAGLCETLRKNPSANVNPEIKKLYESQDPETKKLFDRLFPYILQGGQWIRIEEE